MISKFFDYLRKPLFALLIGFLFSFFIFIILLVLIFKKGPILYQDTVSGYPSNSINSIRKYNTSPLGFLSEGNGVVQEPESVFIDRTTARKTKEDIVVSLKVKNVPRAVEEITSMSKNMGGFVVFKNVNTRSKEGSPYSYSTISVRIPKDVKEGFLVSSKKVGLEVVSEFENLSDISDQYEDITEKLEVLNKNKKRFERIMEQATEVSDILKVQDKILSLQQRIDSLKGRQNYLNEVSKTVKVTFYLSTDEYSLPYIPKDNWNIRTVFNKAVRSLIKTARLFISLLVWLIVYSPILLFIWFFVKWVKNKLYVSYNKSKK